MSMMVPAPPASIAREEEEVKELPRLRARTVMGVALLLLLLLLLIRTRRVGVVVLL